MPGLYKDEGVVLGTIKLGEADRIITLFTRENGKVRAVAKGIRKTKSRFGARLEPFTHVQLVIYRGRNLDTITGADVVESFKDLRREYESLTAAAALAELVDKVTVERERSVSVYGLLLSGLSALASSARGAVVAGFYIKLLSISGYHPQLRVCGGCGTTSDLHAFSAASGGAICSTCSLEEPNAIELSSDRLALMERLLESDLGTPASSDDAFDVTRVLRHYAEYHLERPLRSLALRS